MSVVLNPTASVTDTITVSSTGGPYAFNGATGISVPWTDTSSNTVTLNTGWNTGTSGKIKLEGDNADIEVNGKSLMGMINAIEQRLNILKPNSALELEWAELRALGDQYRALEADIEAKMKTWNAIAK
jgi:hypothetical protein